MSALLRPARTAEALGRSLLLYVCSAAFALAAGVELVRMGSFSRQLKASLLGGALLASAAVIVYPSAAFPAIVGLAPFEFQMKLLGRQAGTNEVLAIGLAIALAPRLTLRAVPRWASVGFGGIVIGSFVTVLVAANKSQALWGSVRWLAVSIVVLTAFQRLRSLTNASAICADIFSATAILVAVFALLQRAGVFWIVGPPYVPGRIDSSFGYYTNYAGYMMVALLVALGASQDAARRKKGGRLALQVAAAMSAAIGLALSLSRGAVFGAAVGGVAMIVLSCRRPRKAFAMVAALIAIVGSAWLALPNTTRLDLVQRFAQSSANSGSDREHYVLAHIGEAALRTHPLGLGFGNFPSYLDTSGAAGQFDQTFFHSHRLPVQVGLDAGWLGLGGFLVLVLAPLIATANAAKRNRLSPTAAGFAGALIGLLAQGWYDYLFYEMAFLVIFSALVWATWHAIQEESP